MTVHDSMLVVGWVATVLTFSSSLPQVVKLVRTHDTHGVSVWTYVLWVATALFWAGWGLHVRAVPMVVVNTALIPLLLIAVVMLHPSPLHIVFMATSAPLLVISLVVLPDAVAVIGTVLACLLAVPSVVEVYRTEDPSGVAIGTWVLLGTAAVLWAIYDSGIGYPWTGISVEVQAVLCCVVIGRTVADRRRLGIGATRPVPADR